MGSAASLNTANSNTAMRRNVNLILLSDQLKFLNFKAKRSILETSNSENATQMVASANGL